MPARDDGGQRGERLFDSASKDPHSLVWLLSPDGTVSRTGDAALSLVDASDESVADQPFQATPWWDESAVEPHVDRATDGEFVRFRATAAGSEVDVVLRPVETADTVEGVLAVAREAPLSAERRTKLAALHDVATRLQSADDEAAVHDLTVRAATDVLEFSQCAVGVIEGETVVPRAWSDGLDREAAAGLDLGGWLAGRVLDDGESVVVDDEASAPPDAVTIGDHSSWLGVPLDDTALLVAAAPNRAAFDGTDREFATVLAAHVGSALRRVRQQHRFRRQNERLEEFASVAAHDLRNPLGAMRANLQVARERDKPDVLDAVERSLDRMDELLADLLELASVGDVAADAERVELAVLVKEAWATAGPADADLQIGRTIAFDADRSRLLQLFENLFDNAVEHGSTSPRSQTCEDAVEHGSTESRTQSPDGERTGPSITVDVGAIDDEGFYVADDGPGIPENARADVFERGFTTCDDGTGFGLSIVRRIAESHGWTATVTESESGGARFEFTGVDAISRGRN